MNTLIYRYLYLPFRKVLCHFNIHDYEAMGTGINQEWAYGDLQCFYCEKGKRSYFPDRADK